MKLSKYPFLNLWVINTLISSKSLIIDLFPQNKLTEKIFLTFNFLTEEFDVDYYGITMNNL